MKKSFLAFASVILLCFSIFTISTKADDVIDPIDNIYEPGIYVLNKKATGTYQLQYQFTDQDKKSAIIVLDKNYNIAYKNVNCRRKCNAGIITSKNTVVVIGGEINFYFTKTD